MNGLSIQLGSMGFYIYTTFRSHPAPVNHLSKTTSIPGPLTASGGSYNCISELWSSWVHSLGSSKGQAANVNTQILYLNLAQNPPSLLML